MGRATVFACVLSAAVLGAVACVLLVFSPARRLVGSASASGRYATVLPHATAGASASTAQAPASATAGSTSLTLTSVADQVSSNLDPWMTTELQDYAGSQLGPFTNGVWTDAPAASTVWACNQAPMTAAATLYVLGGESNATELQEAEATINTAIETRQASNGSFVPPSGDSESIGITTAWFAAEEGTVYHLLSPYLSASTRTAWQNSIAAAATWLVTDGDTAWYANGNLNAVYVEVEWLAWQATGQSQFQTDYNAAWATLMDPNQSQFAGDGWVTTVAPSQSDGADGDGYFTETGAGGTGWDPYYTMLQLDAMSRLYLLSGDSRALQALNMLANQEAPRVNTTSWTLNQSNGTRHTGTEGATGFLDSALFVLALEDKRTGYLSDLMPFLKTYESWYPQPGQADSASFRRAFGNSISTIALAAALANPSQRANLSRYGLLGSSASTSTPVGTSQTPATIKPK